MWNYYLPLLSGPQGASAITNGVGRLGTKGQGHPNASSDQGTTGEADDGERAEQGPKPDRSTGEDP